MPAMTPTKSPAARPGAPGAVRPGAKPGVRKGKSVRPECSQAATAWNMIRLGKNPGMPRDQVFKILAKCRSGVHAAHPVAKAHDQMAEEEASRAVSGALKKDKQWKSWQEGQGSHRILSAKEQAAAEARAKVGKAKETAETDGPNPTRAPVGGKSGTPKPTNCSEAVGTVGKASASKGALSTAFKILQKCKGGGGDAKFSHSVGTMNRLAAAAEKEGVGSEAARRLQKHVRTVLLGRAHNAEVGRTIGEARKAYRASNAADDHPDLHVGMVAGLRAARAFESVMKAKARREKFRDRMRGTPKQGTGAVPLDETASATVRPSLREQAAAHRASKGDWSTRAANLLKRARDIDDNLRNRHKGATGSVSFYQQQVNDGYMPQSELDNANARVQQILARNQSLAGHAKRLKGGPPKPAVRPGGKGQYKVQGEPKAAPAAKSTPLFEQKPAAAPTQPAPAKPRTIEDIEKEIADVTQKRKINDRYYIDSRTQKVRPTAAARRDRLNAQLDALKAEHAKLTERDELLHPPQMDQKELDSYRSDKGYDRVRKMLNGASRASRGVANAKVVAPAKPAPAATAVMGKVGEVKARATGRGTAQRMRKAERLKAARKPKSEPTAPPETGTVGTMATADIHADPARFQYKQLQTNTKTGEVGSVAGVQKWDANMAGVVSVWKDPGDGKTYVINGHNRLALANKLGVKSLDVRHINAANAEEARSIGAMVNIAEGRGESTDAAKVFRDLKIKDAAGLKARGLSLSESKATEGLGLAGLSDPLFHKVAVTREITPKAGAAIGAAGLTPEQQHAVAGHLEQHGLTHDELLEAIDHAKTFGTRKKDDGPRLFGDDGSDEEALFAHGLKLNAHVKKELTGRQNIFGTVSRDRASQMLNEAGNRIDTEESRKLSDEAKQNLGFFHAWKNTNFITPITKRNAEALAGAKTDEERKRIRAQHTKEVIEKIRELESGPVNKLLPH